jgi:hypothetical protein
LREIQRFNEDAENTEETLYLLMKTGGGTKREGLGRGIHWHIENEVWFLATDRLEQNIPYVRVVEDDGSITEYYDVASDITPEDVAGSHLERMDCITCHNRITHRIPDPPEAVNRALSKGLIPDDLPFIREQTEELLAVKYDSLEEANDAFVALEVFYEENYPQIYAERQEELEETVRVMEEMYADMVFPEQKLTWETHPDNLGHKDTPGCFRCHDGKHLTGEEEAIRLECNICHSAPVLSEADELTTEIELSEGPEPRSHTHSSWITLHGRAIDSSCAACHEPASPDIDYTELEGKPPPSDSFCGNVACHANEWEYTGFDEPALEPVLERQLYILLNTSPYLLEGAPRTYQGTFKAMFDGRCVQCHTDPQPEGGLDLSSYEAMMAGGDSGPAVAPGDPDASLLIQRQTGTLEHFGQLLEEEITAVRQWIQAGAPQE